MKTHLLTAMLTMGLLSGCANQSFTMDQSNNSAATSEAEAEPALQRSQHFFFDGIGQRKTVDAAAVCGGADKVDRVETEQTFNNGLASTLTLGIYTPRDVRVFCKKG